MASKELIEQVARELCLTYGQDPDDYAMVQLEADNKRLREALARAEYGLDQIHKSLMNAGPKQVAGEVTLLFLSEARAALGEVKP